MHTDPTLDILSHITTSLGNSFRVFLGKTCAAFQTRELERERVARQRRHEKTAVQKASETSRKPKQLNLKTYKFHSLGDYVETTAVWYNRLIFYPTSKYALDAPRVLLNVSGLD